MYIVLSKSGKQGVDGDLVSRYTRKIGLLKIVFFLYIYIYIYVIMISHILCARIYDHLNHVCIIGYHWH